MLILSNEDIEKILPVGACLDVLEEAYRDLGSGMAATVPRYDVFSPTKPNEFYEYKTMSGVLPQNCGAAPQFKRGYVVRKGRRCAKRQASGCRRRSLRWLSHAFQH
jgi:ornithine cyclodeaminase/alanine dehydrogenase-like protein (mu-crystallin family)